MGIIIAEGIDGKHAITSCFFSNSWKNFVGNTQQANWEEELERADRLLDIDNKNLQVD